MSSLSPFLQFCSRIEIIHMRERFDRYVALERQLSRVGIPLNHPKVSIPVAPTPAENLGFKSKGVYGNYLSHLDILSRSLRDQSSNVLVLEDDAIFRTLFCDHNYQSRVVKQLAETNWDFCFLGHPVATRDLTDTGPLVKYKDAFKWAHAYLVNGKTLPSLVAYLRGALEREAGHPDGGKMYIDGALSQFRKNRPECVCLISSPCLSIQAGSPSGLGERKWYDRTRSLTKTLAMVRGLRDEIWRRTGLFPTA